MQAPVIEIRSFKNLDLSGGVVIEAFPSVGLISAVTGTYIISSLKLDQIAAMESAWFPPVSVIYTEKPNFPARIYASSHHNIAVCLSEFTMPAHLDRPIAKSILSWANEQRCSLVISLCGIPVSEEGKR